MTVIAMKKKIAEYLETADKKDIEAVLTFVENKADSDAFEIDDETYKELQRRTKSFLDGSAKMYTLEEARKIARERFNAKNK